jgi:hypothetical protein
MDLPSKLRYDDDDGYDDFVLPHTTAQTKHRLVPTKTSVESVKTG